MLQGDDAHIFLFRFFVPWATLNSYICPHLLLLPSSQDSGQLVIIKEEGLEALSDSCQNRDDLVQDDDDDDEDPDYQVGLIDFSVLLYDSVCSLYNHFYYSFSHSRFCLFVSPPWAKQEKENKYINNLFVLVGA